MFTNISWKEYALVVAAALFLYYAWLLFIFYAKDILSIFKNKIPEQGKINENDSDEIFGIVYRLQDEIKETITAAVSKKYTKQEIILSLQKVLEKYALQSTPFRYALNNFIERQCQHNTSIHLDADELQQLWV